MYMIWCSKFLYSSDESKPSLNKSQWDLGEFNQKGTVATRWGTREEFLQACETAKIHGIDVLIDAVLNVSLPILLFFAGIANLMYGMYFIKHKLGADRVETFQAVPVNENNRLKNAGPAREIQASWKIWL